jgi:hypothetical protein
MLLLLYPIVLACAWRLMSQVGADPERIRRLAVLAVLGPLAVTLAISWEGADRASVLRLRLTAVRLHVPPSPEPVVEVGGSRQVEGLWIEGLPERFASVRLDAGGQQLSVTYHASTTAGVIAVSQPGEPNLRLLGEVAVHPGDRIVVGAGGGASEITIVSTDRVRVAGVELVLPSSNKLPIGDIHLPVSRFRGVRDRVFPVSAIQEEAAARVGGPAAVSQLRPASFFFHKPARWGFAGDLHVALLDADVTVRRSDGASIHRATSYDVPLTTPAATFHFCSLGTTSQLLEPSSPPTGRPDEKKRWIVQLGIRPLLSGRFRSDAPGNGEVALAFDFAVPQTLSLSRGMVDTLRAAGPRTARTGVRLSLAADPLAGAGAGFTLPKPFSAGQAVVEPDGDDLRVLTPRGTLRAAFGDPFWLGDRFQGLVQIDRIGPGAFALAGVAALAVAVLLVVLTSGVRDPRFLLLLAAVETIVSLRLLLGFQAYNKAPGDFKSYGLALFTFVWLPWAVVVVATALSTARPSRTWLWLNLLCAIPAATIAGSAFSAGIAWVLGSATLATFAIAWPAGPVLGALRRAFALGAARVQRVASGPTVTAVAFVTLPALAMTLLRILGASLGIRERLPTEPPIAISLVYTPLCVVTYAMLAAVWAQRAMRPLVGYAIAWTTYLALVFPVTGFVVSDLGLLLVGLPFVLDGYFRAVDRFGHWRPAAVVALLFVAAAGLLFLNLGAESPGAAIRVQDRNVLRLVAAFHPASLREGGDLDSERLAIMVNSMRAYVESGGKGYLGADVHPVIRPTALREHVTSVFVGGDFGWWGLAAVFFVYLVPVVVGTLYDPRRDADAAAAWRVLTGRFALFVFGLVSMYMVLANANLGIFTGKNVYLLGLDSVSDVLEGAVLLLTAVWCLHESP